MYIYIYCKDSICNDPKSVLGSNVKGPNNKICKEWAKRLGLGERSVVNHGVHDDYCKGELNLSKKTFSLVHDYRTGVN